MRNLTRSLLLASGLALVGGAVVTPALADSFRFGINVGPPAYYYAPPPSYYYAPTPRYYYYDPY
jgi:hypothetical protein